MSVTTKPVFIQAGGETAEQARRMLKGTFGGRAGIVNSTDLAVTQNGTPNMSVNVAGGTVVIPGTESSTQGVYVVENIGTLNVAIAASDPTNARKDLIIAKVQDSAYSGATDAASIVAVTGTPAASPAEPAAPANSWVLAVVTVAAGATSVTNAAISDQRTTRSGQEGRAAAVGGIIPATSAARPSHASGRLIYETDTGRILASDGTANWLPQPRTGFGSGTITTGNNSANVVISFSPAFAQTPTVLTNYDASLGGTPGNFACRVTAVSASSVTVTVYRTDGTNSPSNQGVTFRWVAFA